MKSHSQGYSEVMEPKRSKFATFQARVWIKAGSRVETMARNHVVSERKGLLYYP